MSEATTDVLQRRVLLVADKGTEVDSLRERLAAAGYAADSSDVESVIPFCTDEEFEPRTPSAVLLVFGEREGEGRLVALARRLRTEPSSFALPVLFLFREDTRSLRSSAQHFGADDYFARDASAEELRARGGGARFREAVNDDPRRRVLAARLAQSDLGLLDQTLDLRAVRGERGDADEEFSAALNFGELVAQAA